MIPPQVPKDSARGLGKGQMLQVPMKQGATAPALCAVFEGWEGVERGWCLLEEDDVC